MKTSVLIALATTLFGGGALAHPGGHDDRLSPQELQRRELEANDRHLRARSCASAINEFHAKRREARGLKNRAVAATTTASAAAPHYTTIQNTTCITAPEVTEGPYYVRNELVRQDLRENQGGIPLVLDIGVLDINTCKPLSDAYVELWSANATGHYSEFTTLNSGGGGGGSGGSKASDQYSWLRGGFPTNTQGIVELTTIYPGFYSGRTIHIHTAIITGYKENTNGTISSSSGSLRHIGQLFFDESLNTQVLATSAYKSNTQQHTLNSQDGILSQENSHGYNAFVDTELLGSTISSGVLGYITIGVDTKAAYKFSSTTYWNP